MKEMNIMDKTEKANNVEKIMDAPDAGGTEETAPRKTWRDDRFFSLLIIVAIYGFTLLVAGWIADGSYLPLIYSLFRADIVATVVIFLFSVLTQNASCYDAYWSMAPLWMIIFMVRRYPAGGAVKLTFAAIFLWGLRLTVNWIYTFKNFRWQDWRYVMLKQKTGAFYPTINFVGIHLVPTLVVFFCMRPVILMVEEGASVNAGTIIFFILALCSCVLQGIADFQMHRFRKKESGSIILDGLWKYSRHPNYLGEVLMWWSVGLMGFFSMGYRWDLLAGAVLNTCLFLFVSIPMAENHQKSRKPEYEEYKKNTSMLFLLPPRKK